MRHLQTLALASFILLAAASQTSIAHTQDVPHVTDQLLTQGHRAHTDTWPFYGGSYDQQRFSPLDQITRDNVKKLQPAWTFHTGLYNRTSGYQTTPLIFGGAMYITTPRVGSEQWIIKLDARTGQEIWRTPLKQGKSTFCCGANNRGVTLYDDKVYIATLDASLTALDAATGKVIWKTQTARGQDGYSQTCAPLAYDNKIIIGVAGGEYGIRGFLKAYNAQTGDHLWTWHTIPSPEQGGWQGDWIETAPGTNLSLNRDIQQEKDDLQKYPDAWKHGGVPIWTTPSLDPQLNLIYVTTGNPGPDYDGSIRPGDNLWGDAICAVNVKDGTLAWGFQYVPHDIWDYDGGTPPILFDPIINGQTRQAVGLFTKVGFFYLLDRKTGELLNVSENYVPQNNLFAPLTEEGIIIAPGSAGGTNWSPASYNPQTKLMYAANIHWPMEMIVRPGLDYRPGVTYQGGRASFGGTEGVPTWGYITALDPLTGKVIFNTKTERPMFSGLITTAGGLVFAGQSAASFDAWDAKTGEHLWQYKTQAGCNAAPATYQLDGKQYIVIAAGGSRYVRRDRDNPPKADAIIAFTLP